ncbi:uncharacterized protein [Solanum lycopersicum]|uniref:uncharacterized protein n=1 Tax=Solanum lycopersicum TaxID=4081 RepID=UPI00374A341B
MSVHYHPGKENVEADTLTRLSMGSASYVEEKRKELVKDVHRLARLRVLLMSISDSRVTIQNGARSSLVVEVKKNQESDPIFLELKGVVNNQRVEVFSQGGDGKLCYQGRLCVLDVGELRQHILTESHNSKYSIHPGSTKMYRDLWEFYWSNGMKMDIVDFVSKCPNCQQVKVEHQKPGDRCPQFTAKGLDTQFNLSTTFHPQMDGQAESTIQTLEDMLRACVIDFKGS